jgi:hypothetical protein
MIYIYSETYITMHYGKGLQPFLSVGHIGFDKCMWSAGFEKSGLKLTLWYAVF